jgi:spore maturation protein CgeB
MMAQMQYVAMLCTKVSNYHYLLRKCKMSGIVIFHLHREYSPSKKKCAVNRRSNCDVMSRDRQDEEDDTE